MSWREALATSEILDCQGRTTHRLVLEADGTVSIHFLLGGCTARVDPRNRRNLTPQVRVPDELLAHAATLTPW
jgi:hypothetical protein